MKQNDRKEKKTLTDVLPMDPQELQKGIADLPPIIHDAIKDRLDEIPVYIQEALVQRIQLPRRAMIDYQIPFNRHQMRLLALEAVYQHILLGKDIKKCLFDVLCESNQVDGYLYSLTIGTVDNMDKYKEMLSNRLRSDWEFDRLSILEQGILLISCQDLFVNGIAKAVVIDEAVTIAKLYCDDSAPKMINGILDNLEDVAD